MNPNKSLRRRWWARWGWLLASPLVAGCCGLPGGKCQSDGSHLDQLYHGPEQCPRLIQGASPDPSGAFVRRFQTVQSVNAEMDDFVIYRHEWYLNGTELGPYGKYHLDQIVKRLGEVPFPVLLQISPDAAADQKRRERIVEAIALAGFPDADQRVLIGFPGAEGLYGEEMEGIYTRFIEGGFTGGYLYQGGLGFGFGGFGGFGGQGGFVPVFPSLGFGGFGGGFLR